MGLGKPSASDRRRVVVVGIPRGRRTELLQTALHAMDQPPAHVVPWLELIEGRIDLREVVCPGDIVRIDSPGKDFATERALLLEGAAVDPQGYAALPADDVRALEFDRGRILWPQQWYRGWCAVLRRLGSQLADCPPHVRMGEPADIAVMFDKCQCHARLLQAGVRVPRSLGSVRSYDELISRLQEANCWRVFIKLAHGSSASGVVAFEANGRYQQAITTAELVRSDGEVRLYNSRRIRTYREPRDIVPLIDELCRHKVHVEQWLPKAGIDGRVFDLRVLVIGGRAMHTVVRTSRTPMTNLHLLNERGDVARVRAAAGETAWEAAMRTCEAAMACFPKSVHGGVDLLLNPRGRCTAVLEVNAFGDLLPGILCDGMDTYTAQMRHVFGEESIAAPTVPSQVLAGAGS